MSDCAAACARGRAGPSRAGEAGRSQYQAVLASPMTPIRRRYPCVIRVRGVVESLISLGPAGKLREVRRPLLDVGVAPLLGLLAAVEQEVGVVSELLEPGESVLGGIKARLEQAQREGGERQHLPAPRHRLLLEAVERHDG